MNVAVVNRPSVKFAATVNQMTAVLTIATGCVIAAGIVNSKIARAVAALTIAPVTCVVAAVPTMGRATCVVVVVPMMVPATCVVVVALTTVRVTCVAVVALTMAPVTIAAAVVRTMDRATIAVAAIADAVLTTRWAASMTAALPPTPLARVVGVGAVKVAEGEEKPLSDGA